MKELTIFLKNGIAVKAVCERYSFTNTLGKITAYEFENCQEPIPLYVDPSEIIAITKKEIS